MNRPCPNTIDCRPVPPIFPGELESPILNTSSEAPDPITFNSWSYPPYDPYEPPPLGPTHLYTAKDCNGNVISVISQQVADLLAELGARACQQNDDSNMGSSLQFTNTAQTGTVYCPDGTAFSYTVDAGMFVSPLFPVLDPESTDPQVIAQNQAAIAAWIEAANEQALAYAQQQASLEKCCITTPGNPDGRVPPDLESVSAFCCLGDTLTGDDLYSITGQGAQPFDFSIVSGGLPPGISLFQTGDRTAALIGTATVPGIYSYVIKAVRTNLPTISAQIADTFYVFGLVSSTLPDGTVGTAYSEQLVTAGGVGAVTFSTNDLLPDGLTLHPDGTVDGTPTTGGTTTFTVRFTDSEGTACSQAVSLTITGGCVDWDTLPWGIATFTMTGSAVATFTPDNTTGATFDAYIDVPDAFNDQAMAQNAGFFNYNGPDCNCNLHLEVTSIGTIDPINGCWGRVQVQYNGVFVVLYDLQISGPGTYDFPFTLTDTGGVPTLFSVDCLVQALGLAIAEHEQVHIVGTLTAI